MRILHTSDWHLGRTFGDHSMAADQEAFVDWIVAVVEAEGIDLVAIAGDLHDRSAPSAEAITLLSDAIRRIRGAGAIVVAIAGNHDSHARVAAFDGIGDAGGIILRGGYDAAGRITTLEFSDGPLAIVATPFLDPLLAPESYRANGRPSHESVLADALRATDDALPNGTRSLVLCHAFVTGGEPSESERDLRVGATGMVSGSLFDRFSYTALGHLHRPQAVGSSGRVRYSGSPLAYSFSETHPKEVVVVDLAPSGDVQVTALPVDVGTTVHTVRGSFEELLVADRRDDAWVRVELTDTVAVIDAHRRLRDVFPKLVEIARVGRPDRSDRRLRAEEATTKDPAELATAFWADVTGDDPDDDVRALLADALAAGGAT